MEILTVAIVTKPFNFEGRKRMAQAEAGINKLREFVDSLIVIPNERLKLLTDKKITFLNAFQEADDVLRKGVQSITELITVEGIINLDFADVSAVMSNAGLAHMGVGSAKGKDKAEQAAKMAMSSRCWRPISAARAGSSSILQPAPISDSRRSIPLWQ